jgi:hypothetical protein
MYYNYKNIRNKFYRFDTRLRFPYGESKALFGSYWGQNLICIELAKENHKDKIIFTRADYKIIVDELVGKSTYSLLQKNV